MISGNTPDISEFLEYEWYQPVWYYEPTAFPDQERHLARWIGIAHIQAMCYWLLPKSGAPIARTTIQAIKEEELRTTEVREQLADYDEVIKRKLAVTDQVSSYVQLYREDRESDLIEDNEDLSSPEDAAPDIDVIEPDMYDELLLTEPILTKDGKKERATIIGRKRDYNGNLIGRYINPMHNTVIKAIYNDIDLDGFSETFLVDIIGHEKTDKIETDPNVRYMTKGWNICLSWEDGSTSWHTLADVKNSYPILMAEYAKADNLQDEQVFKWWVKHILKRKARVIKATKS
jgi:hypothetical protein